MSAEPRGAWADGVESFLRQWMESLGPDGFTFRSTECRLSWCVVEAESTVGAGDRRGHDIVLDSSAAKKNRLFQFENMFAKEPGDPPVWHVFVLFKRYCDSVEEVFDSGGVGLVSDFYTLGQHCGPLAH